MRTVSLFKVGTALVISLVFRVKVNLIKAYAMLNALLTMIPVCHMRALLMQKVFQRCWDHFCQEIKDSTNPRNTPPEPYSDFYPEESTLINQVSLFVVLHQNYIKSPDTVITIYVYIAETGSSSVCLCLLKMCRTY